MGDFTTVSFPGLGWSMDVPSIMAQFNLFGNTITIRWYGVLIAFGFILAVLFGGRMAYKWKMSIDKMLDVLIFGTLAGIVGARLYYVVFEWDYFSAHPGDIFKIWEGGLAIYGGLIGAIIAAFIVCRFNKLNFYNLADMAAMSFLIGQGIGRWGNFCNQEAFGGNTTMPWGMISEKTTNYLLAHQADFAAQGITVDPYQPVHPTFFYESVWCLLGFVVLYLICRYWRKFSGQIMLTYGIWYGLERMIVEGLRTDSLYIGSTNLRVSQLLSGLLVVVCTVVLAYMLVKVKKHPRPIEGVDFFPEEPVKKEKKKKETVRSEIPEHAPREQMSADNPETQAEKEDAEHGEHH